MRKLIIATAALAFIASPAFAQDKAGDKSGTAATSSDTMSKDTMKKKTKSKKSAKKTGDDATKQ
jgi:pentapeptide MXKDX repeat protein